MLPLLALTYTATRLGLEAQSAAAFRLLRLGAGIPKSADQIVHESPIPPADIAPARSGRAETALHREEGSQKIGAGWATQEAGQAKVGHFFQFRPDLPTAPLVSPKVATRSERVIGPDDLTAWPADWGKYRMRADRSRPAAAEFGGFEPLDEDQAFLHDQRTLTYTRKAAAAVVPPHSNVLVGSCCLLPIKAALQLRSAGRDYRKPFLLGGCTFALRCCKARLDRVPECQRHRIGL